MLDRKIKWTKTNVKYKGKMITRLNNPYLVPRSYEIKVYNRRGKEVNVGKEATAFALVYIVLCVSTILN